MQSHNTLWRSISDLGTRWGWVAIITSRPHFTPGERTTGTHCTGGWVGPRAGLDTEVRGKIICLCRRSNLDRPLVQSVARHYTDWATPAHTASYRAAQKVPTKFKVFMVLGAKNITLCKTDFYSLFNDAFSNSDYIWRIKGWEVSWIGNNVERCGRA
jgi:hypothetical protein